MRNNKLVVETIDYHDRNNPHFFSGKCCVSLLLECAIQPSAIQRNVPRPHGRAKPAALNLSMLELEPRGPNSMRTDVETLETRWSVAMVPNRWPALKKRSAVKSSAFRPG